MMAGTDVLELAYVGVVMGSLILLAVLWRVLTKMFG